MERKVEEWFEIAEHDLQAARLLLDEGAYFDIVLFHVHTEVPAIKNKEDRSRNLVEGDWSMKKMTEKRRCLLVQKYLWSPEDNYYLLYPSGDVYDISADDFINIDEHDLQRYPWMNKAIQEPAIPTELDESGLQEFLKLAKGRERLYVFVRRGYYGLVLEGAPPPPVLPIPHKEFKRSLKNLKSTDVNLRARAANTLYERGGELAVKPLIEVLEDTDPDVRHWAIEAMVKFGDKRAVEPLIRRLKEDNDWQNVSRAAYALGKIGDKRGVPALIEALQGPTYAALEALGKIGVGDKRAVEPIIKALKDNDRDEYTSTAIRKRAVEVLGEIGGEDVIEPLIKVYKKDRNKGVRLTASKVLDRLGRRPKSWKEKLFGR